MTTIKDIYIHPLLSPLQSSTRKKSGDILDVSGTVLDKLLDAT